MGTDIYMYAEIFDGERWKPPEPLIENEYFDPDDPIEPRLFPQAIYDGRNRDLFSVLTNEIQSSASYQPIAPSRGLPDDLSREISDFERPRHSVYTFGHSWLSLEELLSFDWEGQTDSWNLMDFREHVLPLLKTYGAPGIVRVVFWFNY